ncbi:MAG: hypothetical protein A2428_14240 [Bdellovibrionales bacterium RIFOXYC1_FULL_54_43]|nr:MAG: hypothetical protein A2428_14240 [Bdellovibrionales bacterium RIFOXYC1_FULL_54_43]HLE00950.1 biopolymer transporter ExbD [Bdellovibrionota bacterium]
MSAVVSESSGKRGGACQDFEINIASIIDAFTVLIAFMLVSASYLSIGILDAGVAAAGIASNGNTPPSVNVTLEIVKGEKLVLKVTGKANNTINIEPKSGAADYVALTDHMKGLKSKWQDMNAVTLLADETVEYKQVVKTMEVLRQSMPVVLLGGF